MNIDQWRDHLPAEQRDSDLHQILTDWAFDRLTLLCQLLALQETVQQHLWRKIPAFDVNGVALPLRYDVEKRVPS